MVGLANFGRRSASDSAGRSAGVENRTAVSHGLHDGRVGDEIRTAVGRSGLGRNVTDENRTAVGREAHGRSEIAGTGTGLEARTAVGHEVPVPADDGWSEEESRRLIENTRDDTRILSSGEERDRKASQVLESHGVLTDADLLGVREPPQLGLSNQVRTSDGAVAETSSRTDLAGRHQGSSQCDSQVYRYDQPGRAETARYPLVV